MLEFETRGGRNVHDGFTFDYEDSRMTARYQGALDALKAVGVVGVLPDHDTKCILHPDNRSNRVFGFNYSCECGVGTYHRKPTWPTWVTGEMFDTAWRLTDTVCRKRGEAARAGVTA